VTQELPTSSTTGRATTVALARQLARLVGAGWQAPQGSLNAADVLALAASLDDGRIELLSLLDQAFANTATSLLAELETTYGIIPDASMSVAARQARLVAVLQSRVGGSPQNIRTAVQSLVAGDPTYAPTGVTVHECTAPATPLDRFRFVVVVPYAWRTAPYAARLADVVNRMKPAHTSFSTAVHFGFRCDGVDNSFCDLTALGV